MIRIETKNIFKKTIGKEGLSEKAFADFCVKAKRTLKGKMAGRETGWDFLKLPDDRLTAEKVRSFTTLQKKKWKHIMVLGIGGSALGLIAAKEALLNPFDPKPRLWIVDNIDPEYTAGLFKTLPAKDTLVVVISKSGTTTEPMLLYGLAREKFRHFVFITDPKKGLLRDIAKKEKIVTFDVPETVGGRYSVLSSVGLLPAALAGIKIEELLDGARLMRERIRQAEAQENPAVLLAAAQIMLDRQKDKTITVTMSYGRALFRFGDWYRQLLAESLGKNSKTGPTPVNALGTTDQHSQLQLYEEGPLNKWILFLRTQKPRQDLTMKHALPGEMKFLNGKKMSDVIDAAYSGTAQSLAKNGRPSLTLTIDALDARTLGALFMLFECQVALLGPLYGVNPFDQPGVEQSKIITKKLLSRP